MKKVLVTLSIIIASYSLSYAGVDGKYVYKESGFKGTLEIKKDGNFLKVNISTINVSNGADCGFEDSGMLMGDTMHLIYKDENREQPTSVSIKFKGKTATVEGNNLSQVCGVGGIMGGKYVKAKSK